MHFSLCGITSTILHVGINNKKGKFDYVDISNVKEL